MLACLAVALSKRGYFIPNKLLRSTRFAGYGRQALIRPDAQPKNGFHNSAASLWCADKAFPAQLTRKNSNFAKE